jgi:hypothetical protein
MSSLKSDGFESSSHVDFIPEIFLCENNSLLLWLVLKIIFSPLCCHSFTLRTLQNLKWKLFRPLCSSKSVRILNFCLKSEWSFWIQSFTKRMFYISLFFIFKSSQFISKGFQQIHIKILTLWVSESSNLLIVQLILSKSCDDKKQNYKTRKRLITYHFHVPYRDVFHQHAIQWSLSTSFSLLNAEFQSVECECLSFQLRFDSL